MLLIIVGEFDDTQLMQAVAQHYGPWDRKSASLSVPTEPPQNKERSVHIDWPQSTQPRLTLAWHTPAAKLETADAAIQSVLADYLVGPTSPLYKELVLDKQLAQEIGSDFSIHRDPNLFSLVAILQEERHTAAVRSAFGNAIKDLATGKVDAPRVEAIKSHTRYDVLMHMETAQSVASQLAWYAGIYGTPDALARHLQKVSEVKPSDLVTFTRKYLTAANRTQLTLTPPSAGAPK